MNHKLLALPGLLVALAMLGGCGAEPPAAGRDVAPAGPQQAVQAEYTCPMHPQVRSHEPGRCPICGMDLVPVQEAQAGENPPLYYRHPHNPQITSPVPRKDEMGMDYVPVYAPSGASDDVLQLSPAMVNNLGVRTAVVRRGPLSDHVDAVGTLAYDERGRIEVRVRAEGYVEKLAIRAEGERVTRGQLLFAVFSPRLATAQREFEGALAMGEPSLIAASAARLAALGLDEAAIARLRKGGRIEDRVSYYAPEDGVVVAMGVREGALAEPGMNAMVLAPIARLWVVANIAESDAARVLPGAAVELRLPAEPGKVRRAHVLEVLPQLDEPTRTLQARIELDNTGGRLAAGMLADVTIDAGGARQAVLIPGEALIRTGRAERVVLALGGGRFVASEVRAGEESGEEVEILEGVEPGQQVVVSGQFMLDSESQVRSGLRRFSEAHDGDDTAPSAHDHSDLTGSGT